MLAAVSVFIVAPLQGVPAKERLAVFLNRSPYLAVEAEVTLTQGSSRQQFQYIYRKSPGSKQSLKVTAPSPKPHVVEFRQNGSDAIVLYGGDGNYEEYSALPPYIGPPSDSNPLLVISYPSILRTGKGTMVASGDVKSQGDTITYHGENEAGKIDFSLTVDGQGRPVSLHEVTEGMITRVLDIAFRNVHNTASEESFYSLQPPTGWMPVSIKERVPVNIGDKVGDLSFVDGRGLKTSLKALAGSGAALIFTSAGCLPSAGLRKALPSLAPKMTPKGYRAVEVVLGSDPLPAIPGIEQVQDRSGALEAALRVPMTPCIMCLDGDLRVRSAYQGFSEGQAQALIKAVHELAKVEP